MLPVDRTSVTLRRSYAVGEELEEILCQAILIEVALQT